MTIQKLTFSALALAALLASSHAANVGGNGKDDPNNLPIFPTQIVSVPQNEVPQEPRHTFSHMLLDHVTENLRTGQSASEGFEQIAETYFSSPNLQDREEEVTSFGDDLPALRTALCNLGLSNQQVSHMTVRAMTYASIAARHADDN